jgi:hypothetical protein
MKNEELQFSAKWITNERGQQWLSLKNTHKWMGRHAYLKLLSATKLYNVVKGNCVQEKNSNN